MRWWSSRPARAPARCGTSTRWWPRRFGDEALARRAEAVAARTYELSELLVDVLGVEDVGAYYPHRVTYHPTCHSLRLLRVGDRPLRLLRQVAGIDLVELPDAEVCCGFGGTFAVKNAAVSTAMLADKMRSVLATGAEVCTAGRQLLPDAHRRRPVPAERRHGHRAPGRNPRARPRTPGEHVFGHAIRPARGRPPARREPFPVAARAALADTQLRRNLGKATRTIRAKRAAVVAELPDWEELRAAGEAIKTAHARPPG